MSTATHNENSSKTGKHKGFASGPARDIQLRNKTVKLDNGEEEERRVLPDLDAFSQEEAELELKLKSLKEKKALEEVRVKGVVVAEIVAAIKTYNEKHRLQIEATDLAEVLIFGRAGKGNAPSARHPRHKYRNPSDGATWIGNARNPGRRPDWVSALIKSEFLSGTDEEKEQAYAPTDALIVHDGDPAVVAEEVTDPVLVQPPMFQDDEEETDQPVV